MRRPTILLASIFGLGGFFLGAQVMPSWAGPQEEVNPQERVLDANLWMQTSAEYRALCLQTYRFAAERLKSKLKVARSSSARPWAVVLDLDETVIDNSAFQTFLDKNRLTYSDAIWEKWEAGYPEEVRLVPGAKAFIGWLESEGISAVYVSNRLELHRAATVQALRLLGLNVDGIDERLYLKTTTSDKTDRRDQIRKRFDVIMLVGDNLRDFSETFVMPKFDSSSVDSRIKAVQDRFRAVDRHQFRFGGDFIVLPNPVYGEWQKPFFANPRDGLRPTKMSL